MYQVYVTVTLNDGTEVRDVVNATGERDAVRQVVETYGEESIKGVEAVRL